VGEPLLGATLRRGRVIAATAVGRVLVADAQTGRSLEQAATGQRAIGASFAEDGTTLLTGADGRLRVVPRGGRVLSIPRPDRALGAALSPDASLAVVIGRRDVRIVDVPSGRVRQVILAANVLSAAMSRDNRLVVTGRSDETVLVWNARTGRLLHALPYNQGHDLAVAFSPSGDSVAGASTDGLARIWSVRDGALTATVSGGAISLTDVAFSSDGAHVVTASRDGVARVSKADTGAFLFALSGHDGALNSATFSGAAGSSVVTASVDGTARVWDALFQPEVDELARVRGPVRSVAYLRPGVIRVDTRTGARALDARTGKPVTVASMPRAASPRRAISHDGATATVRGNIVVLRHDGQKTILVGHRAPIASVAFSPDGKLLASASRDRDVRIWDVRTGDTIRFLPHNSPVRDAEFSPDGRWLIAGAARATLWDARDWTLVARLVAGTKPVTSAAFDPSGRIIVTGDADGTVGRYVCEICGSLAALERLANRRLAQTGRTLTPAERERYTR
jgi:WD40 repeat protein